LRCKNARTEFANCKLDLKGGFVCARLGVNRKLPASFRLESDQFSISAFVRRGVSRSECQDSAMVLVSESLMAAGVFDGWGKAGTLLSETAPDLVIELLAANPNANFPLESVSKTISRLPLPPPPMADGGCTAAFASVIKDGGTTLDGVSDAAIFGIRRNKIKRHLKYYLDRHGEDVNRKTVAEYLRERHYVRNTIEFGTPEPAKIESDGTIMDPGNSLILVTDGVTKSLTIRFDPESGKVTDNSGIGDLSRILRGSRTSDEMVAAVIGAIDDRLCRPKRKWKYGKDAALHPEDDDIAVIAIKRRGPSD